MRDEHVCKLWRHYNVRHKRYEFFNFFLLWILMRQEPQKTEIVEVFFKLFIFSDSKSKFPLWWYEWPILVVSAQFYTSFVHVRHTRHNPEICIIERNPLVVLSQTSPHPKGEWVWIIDIISGVAPRAHIVKRCTWWRHTCAAL